jgi:hypothetical protein
MAKSVLWTEKQRETCKEMALQGYTTREIGAVIKRTKGSIIGYLHRIGVRLSDHNPTHKPKTIKATKPSKPTAVRQKKPIEIKELPEIPFFEARMFQCRFITQEAANVWETKCCGQTTVYRSWCQKHFKIVFRPKEKK